MLHLYNFLKILFSLATVQSTIVLQVCVTQTILHLRLGIARGAVRGRLAHEVPLLAQTTCLNSAVQLVCFIFPFLDHMMVPQRTVSLKYRPMYMHPRAYVCILKKLQIDKRRTSRGPSWENKTYELKRSINKLHRPSLHDVTSAILVSQNNKMSAMFLPQTNLVGVEPLS